MVKMLSNVIILLCQLLLVNAVIALEIHVNPKNGAKDHKKWTGGNYLPYKDHKPATYIQLTSSSNQTCQQHLLDKLRRSLCKKDKHNKVGDIHELLQCSDNFVISVRDCDCVTYDNDSCSVLLGACPYGCGFKKKELTWSGQVYHSLPGNFSEYNFEMCGRLNRDGHMCSKCMKDFSPLVYSYDLKCVPCVHSHYSWLEYIAVAFVPLTAFYLLVLLFRIDATSPYLYGFITLNQALASPISLRALFLTLEGYYLLVARLLAIPYTIWNLDFFRSLQLNICLDLTTLQTLALDYAIAIYPLLLVLITYIVIELHARGCKVLVWLWRPFHRSCVRFSRVMDIQSSIIKAFATFLLLSYVKLLNATSDILLPVQLYHGDTHTYYYYSSGWYVYYDASYNYFSKNHLPYALMSIFLFLIFGVLPLILIVIYPLRCFQKHCHGANNYALCTFVDAFQGHYKDGTEPGTHDCRWFAGVYFLGRIMIIYIMFGAFKNAVCYTLAGLSLMAIGMLVIILRPFKSRKVNIYHTLLPFIMATGCFSITLINQVLITAMWMIKLSALLVGFFFMLPILTVILYAVYRCYRKCHTIWLQF